MKLWLDGRVALANGANCGIGMAIAAALAREETHPCLVTRDVGKSLEVAESLREIANINVLVHLADLRDSGEAEEAVARAVRYFGQWDLLVNNAAATKKGGNQIFAHFGR